MDSTTPTGKRWYVVHAYSGYEKKVATVLKEKIALAGLDDFFGDVLVPVEEVVEMRKDKKVTSERKFFPGYVLVQMEFNPDTWQLVRHVPQVLGFIGGTKETPRPISDQEVEKILSRIEEGHENPKPKTMFESGEMVRVIDGPFSDFEAVVEEVDYEKNTLQVNVMIFGRATPVDLEFGQVVKN